MNINAYIPKGKLNKKHILSLTNCSSDEVFEILYQAKKLKQMNKVGEKIDYLQQNYLTLLTKPSFASTRIAFKMAVEQIGGKAITITMSGSQIEETLKDKDMVTVIEGNGVKAFVVDTSMFTDAETINHYVKIPIINANSQSSPVQAIATLLTLWEHKKYLQDLKVAVIGDVNQSDNSLLLGLAKCGVDICIISPNENAPKQELISACRQMSNIEFFDNVEDGLRNVDAVYVLSHCFGDKFILNEQHFKYAKNDALILHALPINRKEEIVNELVECNNSVVYEQSTNMLFAMQSIISLIIPKNIY